MKKTTLKDIAKELNLSPTAVGRALSKTRGNTRISDETRRRVLEAAARLNYQTHAAARAMRTKRTDNIGFSTIQKAHADYSFTESYLEGLSDVAAEHGQNIVFVQLPRNPDRFDEIPRALREQCLDALVVFEAADFLPGFKNAIEASGVPVIYLNEKQPTNAVYIDDVMSGRLMTEHLIGRGFKKIAMLTHVSRRGHYSFVDRVTGYLQAMRVAGLKPDVKPVSNKLMLEEAGPWLSSSERPEAIFCDCDMLAMALQRTLYALRIRIPDEIAIAGCNGEEQALRSTVPLTTLEIPFRAMAAHACRMALELVNHPETQSIPSVILNPKLIIAESSSRPEAH